MSSLLSGLTGLGGVKPGTRGRLRPVWEEEPSKTGLASKGVVMVLICLAVLFPLWVVIVTSLSSVKTITEAGGLVVIPRGITFVAYQELWAAARSPVRLSSASV